MAERRGHRKLRLCSMKYYEKHPKSLLVSIPRNSVSILPVSLPISLVDFTTSLLLSLYTELPVPSPAVLHNRVQRVKAMPHGKLLILICLYVAYHRRSVIFLLKYTSLLLSGTNSSDFQLIFLY